MKVFSISDEKIRKQIEDWTHKNTAPDVILFVRDGAGSWFVTENVINKSEFEPIRNLILSNGQWVDYTPPVDIDEE